MSEPTKTSPVPPPLVAVAGWILPGAGYFLLGHRTRGVLVLIAVAALFIGGMLIGGVRVVDAPDLAGPGNLLQRIAQKPWFIGQILAGPVAVLSAFAGKFTAASHARVFEIGTLYTAVAGMLNLMTMIDSAHRAAKGDVR